MFRDNIHKFRTIKWGDPKRFKMIAGAKPRSRYFTGLVVLSVLIGFVAVMAWPHAAPTFQKLVSQPSPSRSVSGPLPKIVTHPNESNFITVRPGASAAPVVQYGTSRSDVTIVDGDTVRSGGVIYRLVGFDTPERGDRALCDRERDLAEKASSRLRALIMASEPTLERTACACRAGTEGTQACNFGRSCAYLRVGGKDVGEILIREGLAQPFVCGQTSCPPRKRWC